MRILYETQKTKLQEEYVANKILTVWERSDLYFRKLSIAYQLDFMFYRRQSKRAEFIVEVKSPTKFAGEYPEYKIAKSKLREMRLVRYIDKLPSYLFINFIDAIYFYKYNPEHSFSIFEWGRTDRNDPADLEPCNSIPMDYFERLLIKDGHSEELIGTEWERKFENA